MTTNPVNLFFDHAVNDFKVFKSRLLSSFVKDKVKPTDLEIRKASLLTYLSEGSYKLLESLCVPKTIEESDFNQLLELLQNHFTPSSSYFTARHKFYTATKLHEETARQWSARLRSLATDCAFGAEIGTVLRDIFVSGYDRSLVQDRLMEEDASLATVTFADMVDLATRKESTLAARSDRNQATIKKEPTDDIHYFKKKGFRKKGTSSSGKVQSASKSSYQDAVPVEFYVLRNFQYKWKIANGWKMCKRSDPKRDQCITEAAHIAITSVVKSGVKKHGVFPAEPLRFNELLVDQSNGPVSIKLEFSDLDVFGLKDIKINKASWNKGNLDLDASVPRMMVVGKYDISGKVLVLPIVGQGKSNITIQKSHITAELQLSENARGKNKYFNCDKMLLKIDGEKVYFEFENLFNGDKRLGDNMNLFLNENWELIWEEVQPAIQASFGQAIQEISNRIFSKVPSTEIAPP